MTAFRLRTMFNQPLNGSPSFSRSASLLRRYRAYLLLAVFIAVCAAVIWSRHQEREIGRAVELRFELTQIRTAISVYVTRHGEPPPDLETLAKARITLPGSDGIPLLEAARFDEAGALVDPYGNPYMYDRVAGTVYSSSPCCRNW